MYRINILGDFAPTTRFLDEFQDKRSVFSQSFVNFLEHGPLNICNLEAPIIEAPYPVEKFGPVLSTDKRCLELLDFVGINVVTLANNHIMDHGAVGLKTTFERLKKNNTKWFGAGNSLTEATQPFIVENDGISIALINIADNEFSNTYSDNDAGASPLDLINNTLQIIDIAKKVDHVIVIVHGGAELHKTPSPNFRKLLKYFAKIGASAVLAHHTHCYNGYEIIDGVPIVYGLGNFVFPGVNQNYDWSLGIIASLDFLNKNKVRLTVTPFMQSKEERSCYVRFLDNREMEMFKRIDLDRRKCLEDDFEIEKRYLEYIDSLKSQYSHFLQPYNSKYLHKLFSVGLFPDLSLGKRRKALFTNLVRCEAHRDALLRILND